MTVFNEHRQYLDDRARTEHYRAAIGQVVRSGSVVVDLGSGTGIFGMLAAEAGAARVYAIEAQAILALAKATIRRNGFSDQVTFLRGRSEDIDIPEKADVVVCDQIGQFGFEAGLHRFFADARKRFLKSDAMTIPSVMDYWVVGVGNERLDDQVEFWRRPHYGFDFAPFVEHVSSAVFRIDLNPADARTAPTDFAQVPADDDTPFGGTVNLPVVSPGSLAGLACGSRATLAGEISVTNSPFHPSPIQRGQAFLPLARPIRVQPGDIVTAVLRCDPRSFLFSWRVEVTRDGQVRTSSSHAGFAHRLLTKEDLARSRPTSRPRLSRRGEATEFALSLCDGDTPLADIEARVHGRFPAQFSQLADAQEFVAAVLANYTS